MAIFNWNNLDKISKEHFTRNKVFPYIEIDEVINKNEYLSLLNNMPDIQFFYENKGEERRDGTKPHSRFGYGGWNHKNLEISKYWKNFIDEILSKKYKKFLARLFDTNDFALRFMWHYAGEGQSVSPHYDSNRKLGSHIFYFNAEDWDKDWGQTVLCFDKSKKLSQRICHHCLILTNILKQMEVIIRHYFL